MGFYRYKLLTPQGRMERGTVDLPFDDPMAAMRYLERRGGVALEVSILPSFTWGVLRFINQKMKSVPREEMAEFFNNMSMLTTAGVPVLTALEEVRSDTKHPVLRDTLKFMCTDIESGQTFAEALDRHANIFPFVCRQMIRIGEETGNIDVMLKKSSEHLIHMQEIIGSTKKAMMYPSFLSVVVVGAVFFWFYAVVPQIVKLFYELGVTLPFMTKVLIAISDWFQDWALISLGGFVGFIFLMLILRKSVTKIRYYQDYLIIKSPIVGPIVEMSAMARICEYLGLLTAAGVGVLRTLEIITDSVSNLIYTNRLLKVQESIKMGNTLTSALRAHHALHPFALRMILVGEQTGKLEEQTEYVAMQYRGKLKDLVDMLGKSLEPIMLIFVGGLFALIMAGLLMPIYDLIANIKA